MWVCWVFFSPRIYFRSPPLPKVPSTSCVFVGFKANKVNSEEKKIDKDKQNENLSMRKDFGIILFILRSLSLHENIKEFNLIWLFESFANTHTNTNSTSQRKRLKLKRFNRFVCDCVEQNFASNQFSKYLTICPH